LIFILKVSELNAMNWRMKSQIPEKAGKNMQEKQSTPPCEIRKASEADFTALYDLQLRAYQTEDLLYEYTIPPLLQSREEAVEDCCQASLVLVAINEKKEIIGSVRGVLEQQVCTISKLMVEPVWRRRGIATALLREMEARLPAKKWYLFTGIKSQGNILLYCRNGYKKVRTDHEKELVYLEKAR
jgi:ribosomal protein S18 acetylase RimI-like enzyme